MNLRALYRLQAAFTRHKKRTAPQAALSGKIGRYKQFFSLAENTKGRYAGGPKTAHDANRFPPQQGLFYRKYKNQPQQCQTRRLKRLYFFCGLL
jgi:hypothetical protein